ncbi:MAG: hypothetical protein JWM33_1356 [Caulobacteraceae bacterium]|nr:hypothetical protein [Caulobacteraceae bacterium]
MEKTRSARRTNWAVAGLAILALSACDRGDPRPAAPSGLEASYLAAADPDSLLVGASWDGMEIAAIAAGAPAQRAGPDLTLRLSKARPLTLKTIDYEGCEEDGSNSCARYALLYDLPWLGVMLVGKDSFDVNDVWMYDKATGRATGFTSLPKFSPDGQLLLVRKLAVEPQETGELEIWRRKGDQAVMEWSQPIPKVRAPDPIRLADAKVKILGWKDSVITLDLSDEAGDAWPGTLSLSGGQWTLAQTPPAGAAGP